MKAKAILIEKGFSRVKGVDYFEPIAPTPNAASTHLEAGLARTLDLDVNHFDVEQTFVQSELDKGVYTRLPSGCGMMPGSLLPSI